MKTQSDITRYEFIDALRGFAILMVIFTHTLLIVPPSLPFLRLLASRGIYGVQLFFLVSALTLFFSMEQRSRAEEKPVRNFFIRRFFRIAPAFYLGIIFYTFYFGTGPAYWAPTGLHWWQYVLTVLFLNSWHPEAINAIIPLGWSVAVEMMFYLLIPFLYKILKAQWATLVFIISSLLVHTVLIIAYKPFLLEYATGYLVQRYFEHWLFSQLPVFGMGILAYQILRQREPDSDRKFGGALILTGIFLAFAFLTGSTYNNLIPHYVMYSVAFFFITAGLYLYPNKAFVNPLTRWIGKVSYSLYFIHIPVLFQLKAWVPLDGCCGKTTQFSIYFLAAVAVSFGIALLTYHWIEVPGMEMGKKLIKKLETLPVKSA